MDAVSDLDFDPATGSLGGPSGTARLAPQPAQALRLLLEADGELVSREALLEAIWPGERFGVSERLTYCIHQLREALNRVGLPGAIETLPRRGYRLAVPEAATVASATSPSSDKWSAWPALAALLLLAIVMASAPQWLDAPRPTGEHEVHAARHQERH